MSSANDSSEPLLAGHADHDDIDLSPSPKRPSLFQSRYVVACALYASIGGLIFGYGKTQTEHIIIVDQGIVSAILVMPHFSSRFPMDPFMKGMLTSSLELGAFFGSLTCSPLADRYSRKYTILLGCVIFAGGALLQAIAGTIGFLFWGRVVGGWGVGMLSCLAPLYMSEISPKELRGSLLALEQFSIVSGVVVGFWYIHLTGSF
jgi:MFS family permease